MTEHDDIDQAERIRRLQERRAASAKSRAVATPAGDGSRPARRPRRRHPAAATRILLAGLSVASFFTVGGTMLLTSNKTTTVATPTIQTTTQPAVGSGATQATVATPAASAATKSTAASVPTPHTKTRGS